MAGRGGQLPLRLWPLHGIPEVRRGDDLPRLLADAAAEQGVQVGDVLIVAHKVVSKSEGRVVALDEVEAGPEARRLADETGKPPGLCELILAESARIVRRRGGTLICETHHGFVCAHAGIDRSNVAKGLALLLPRDPDA
ncbi:MAG: coenzyme F420-0:L-glutamate ligase, partial [Miltoncostaeaceae bacterium]